MRSVTRDGTHGRDAGRGARPGLGSDVRIVLREREVRGGPVQGSPHPLETYDMRFLLAWLLGVPAIVTLICSLLTR